MNLSESNNPGLMQLTLATMRVFDGWGLETEQMRELLAMPHDVRSRSFNRFRCDMPFPDDPQVLSRAGYILRIAEALRTTFPTNPHMAGRWIRMGHRRFGNRPPLTVMLQDTDGLITILAQLDCTFSWDQTSSTLGTPTHH